MSIELADELKRELRGYRRQKYVRAAGEWGKWGLLGFAFIYALAMCGYAVFDFVNNF